MKRPQRRTFNLQKSGHFRGGFTKSAVKAPRQPIWKKGQEQITFPADPDNPTPEELEEIERRTAEIRDSWSDEERSIRMSYDPDSGPVRMQVYNFEEIMGTLAGKTGRSYHTPGVTSDGSCREYCYAED